MTCVIIFESLLKSYFNCHYNNENVRCSLRILHKIQIYEILLTMFKLRCRFRFRFHFRCRCRLFRHSFSSSSSSFFQRLSQFFCRRVFSREFDRSFEKYSTKTCENSLSSDESVWKTCWKKKEKEINSLI